MQNSKFVPCCDTGCKIKARAANVRRSGFSLIEILVAISLFAIVTSILVGAFVQQIRTNRIAIAMISINDAMGLTFEQMSREVRTGYNFCISGNNLSNISEEERQWCNDLMVDSDTGDKMELQFANANNMTVRYRLNKAQGAIERGTDMFDTTNSINNDAECESANIGGTVSDDGRFCYQKITSDNVYIKRLNFLLEHNDQIAGVYYPPRITMSVEMTSSEPDVKEYGITTNMQTTLSARNF